MKQLSLLLLIFITPVVYSQNFQTLLDDFAGALQTVNAEKKEITQTLEPLDQGVLLLRITETDSKGKSKTTEYLFNIADIDKHTLLPRTKGSVIVLEPMAEAKQRVIKKIYDNGSPKYVYQLKIYATDINNARELAKKIKALIEPAKKSAASRIQLNGYAERIDWLKNHATEIQRENKTFTQAWDEDHFPGSLIFKQEIKAKKSSGSKEYHFHLATLHPRRIKFVVKDNIFGLKVETSSGDKLIRTLKDGNPAGYVKSIFIATDDVELARDFRKVLDDLIKDAEKKIDNLLPESNSINELIEKFNENNRTVQLKDRTLEQHLNGNCLLEYKLTETKKGKTYEHIYRVELQDLYNKNIRYVANGTSIYILLPVKAENKFIAHIENGKTQAYRSKMFIYVNQAEDAIVFTRMFKNAIKKCASKNKKKYDFEELTVSSLKNLLVKNTGNVENESKTIEQILEFDEDNIIRLKKVTGTSKSSTEYIYEIGLNDLNPNSVKIKISGKTVEVTVSTKQSAKIIKYYKNGKIQPYRKDMIFAARDIQNAKKIAGILTGLIKKSGN